MLLLRYRLLWATLMVLSLGRERLEDGAGQCAAVDADVQCVQ